MFSFDVAKGTSDCAKVFSCLVCTTLRFCSKTDQIKISLFFHDFFAVPMEITTFLGAAFAFIALGLVFFLYINRKWCFKPPKGSFSSCDESLLASTKTLHNFSKYPCVIRLSFSILNEIFRNFNRNECY